MRDIEVKGALRNAKIQEGFYSIKSELALRKSELLATKRHRNSSESLVRKSSQNLAQEEARVLILAKELQSLECELEERTREVSALRKVAAEAHQQAEEEFEAARHAKANAKLALRRERYSQHKYADVKDRLREIVPARRMVRTDEEWSTLSRWARYKAAERAVADIRQFLSSSAGRPIDIANALEAEGLVDEIFNTKPFFAIYFLKVGKLVETIEKESFGVEFGLMLHYDLRLPVPKILQLTQAASKLYDRESDTYRPKPLLYDPYHAARRSVCGERTQNFIALPRIAPPASKLLAVKRELEAKLNVDPCEDGRIALKSFEKVVGEMLAQDPGRYGMPKLNCYIGGKLEFPIIISFDGTGYGAQ